MAKTLSEQGFTDAARELGVEPAVIRAVAEVESAGDGFLPDGRVKILFERHKFHTYTNGKFDASHPDISAKSAGGYGKGGAHQYARFSEAFELDPEAAMKSASWGKFQIMGFNHQAAGFPTVGEFVDAHKVSEDEQLKAFVKLIKSFGLRSELQNHDWAGFARQYNGAAYKKNRYDTKMAAAYERFKNDALAVKSPSTETLKTGGDDGTQNTEKASGAVSEPEAKEVKTMTMSTASKTLTFSMIGTAILGFLKEAWSSSREQVLSAGQFALAHLPMTFLIIGLAVLGVWIYNTAAKRRDERLKQIIEITSNKTKNDVVIT